MQNPCLLKIPHVSVIIFSFTSDIYFPVQGSSKYLSVRLALSTYSYQGASRQVCDQAADSEAGAKQDRTKIQGLTKRDLLHNNTLQWCKIYSYYY